MSDPIRNIKLEPTNNAAKEVYDILVIDRSSSMSYQRDNTISGINTYVKKLQEDAETLKLTTYLSMIFFDSNVETLFAFTDVKEFVPLTRDTYVPNGMTALNDAVGLAIDMLRERLKGREADDNVDVTVTIFTDGEENHSIRYPGSPNMTLKGLVKELEDSYKWSFAFVGGGSLETVVAQASTLGISSGSAAAYTVGAAGPAGAAGAIGDSMTMARSTKMRSFSSGLKSSGDYFTSVNTLPNNLAPLQQVLNTKNHGVANSASYPDLVQTTTDTLVDMMAAVAPVVVSTVDAVVDTVDSVSSCAADCACSSD